MFTCHNGDSSCLQVRRIKNEADEISERANAQSESMNIRSHAGYAKTTETAQIRGLRGVFNVIQQMVGVCKTNKIGSNAHQNKRDLFGQYSL